MGNLPFLATCRVIFLLVLTVLYVSYFCFHEQIDVISFSHTLPPLSLSIYGVNMSDACSQFPLWINWPKSSKRGLDIIKKSWLSIVLEATTTNVTLQHYLDRNDA